MVPLTYGKPRLVYQKVTRLVRRYEKVVEATDKATLQGFIGKTTADNAMVYTDGATAYQGLPIHEAVAHSVGEYVREMAHTNGIESFWSMLKRGHYGIYHQMSPTHLGRYVTEFSGRHNARPSDTIDQMEKMAKATYGKRLRYVDLIAD